MKNCFVVLLCFLFAPSLNAQTLRVPPREQFVLGGSGVVAAISSLTREAREERLFQEITTGNVPEFMRALCPVTLRATAGGQPHEATFFVIPDYLAVGADSDYFLAPMTPLLAQRIADQLRCTLPTRLMVNAIYVAATVKLAPSPIAPSGAMVTVPVFNDHNTMVWQQRAAVLSAHPLGELVGGDKKDVVISNKIYQPKLPPAPQHPVVIYGWHRLDGTPIQPLYNGHEETYADYSHGIRLVQDTLLLDGAPAAVTGLLKDPVLSVLLSDEGVISVPRYMLPAVPASTPTESEQPEGFLLEQNYPNPFNPVTQINYTIGQGEGESGRGGKWGRNVSVQLSVYDLLGRQVAVLVNEPQMPGRYQVTFHGAELSSGVYFYRLRAGSFMEAKKLALLR